MTATLCVLPHDEPRRASEGFLCGGHYRRLDEDLAQLPQLYDDLLLVMTASAPKGEGKNPTKAGSRVPYVVAAGDARQDLERKTQSWALLWADERQLVDRIGDLERSAELLRSWLPDIARQPWVDEFATEMRDAIRSARMVAYPEPITPLDHACPVVTTCDTTTREEHICGGCVGLRLAADEARCRQCGSAWQGRPELIELALAMGVNEGEVITAHEAAKRLADHGKPVAVDTVRKWWTRHYVVSVGMNDQGHRLYEWTSIKQHAGLTSVSA